MAENKVVFGLKKVHYALITESQGDDGLKIEYAKPVALPGAVSLEMESRSETSDFHADDIVYYTSSVNQGYEATLEIANITEQFRKEVLGDLEDDNGILIENVATNPKKIALLFEFDGDQKATRHCLTYCTVTRPAASGATKTDTAEPNTMELTVVAAPRPTDYIPKFSTGSTTSDTVYNAWYDEVQDIKLNTTAPTATVAGNTGNTNNGTTLHLVYDKLLHVNGQRVADKADIKANYDITGNGASITKAEYTASTKTVVLTVAGATNNSAITSTGLTGFNGAAVTDKYIYNATGTVWTKA